MFAGLDFATIALLVVVAVVGLLLVDLFFSGGAMTGGLCGAMSGVAGGMAGGGWVLLLLLIVIGLLVYGLFSALIGEG